MLRRRQPDSYDLFSLESKQLLSTHQSVKLIKSFNSCPDKLDQLDAFFDSRRLARQQSLFSGDGETKFFDKFEPEAVCLSEERFGGDPNLPRHNAYGDGPKFVSLHVAFASYIFFFPSSTTPCVL